MRASPDSEPSTPTVDSALAVNDDEADDATATPEGAAEASGDEGVDGGVASESRRQVPREEAEAYAAENNLLFFETSAKTGEGVVEVFTEIGGSTFLKFRLCFFATTDLGLGSFFQPRRSLLIIFLRRLELLEGLTVETALPLIVST